MRELEEMDKRAEEARRKEEEARKRPTLVFTVVVLFSHA